MDQPLPMHGPGMGGPHGPGGGPPLGPPMSMNGPPGGGPSLPPPPPGDSFPPSSLSNNSSVPGVNNGDVLGSENHDGVLGNGGPSDFSLGDLPPPRPSPDFQPNSGTNS